MLIVLIILLLILYFDPKIDKADNKILLWYNSNNTREYIILWENM